MSSPEKTFRIGFVSASVFVNMVDAEDGKRDVRNVTLQRRYRDVNGNWQSSTGFGLADLPAAIRVLELAQLHVEQAET